MGIFCIMPCFGEPKVFIAIICYIHRHFIVFHEGREEKVVIDLQNAQQGWILIGTFRLENGSARVELTDENKSSLVIADAVKWTKKQ